MVFLVVVVLLLLPPLLLLLLLLPVDEYVPAGMMNGPCRRMACTNQVDQFMCRQPMQTSASHDTVLCVYRTYAQPRYQWHRITFIQVSAEVP